MSSSELGRSSSRRGVRYRNRIHGFLCRSPWAFVLAMSVAGPGCGRVGYDLLEAVTGGSGGKPQAGVGGALEGGGSGGGGVLDGSNPSNGGGAGVPAGSGGSAADASTTGSGGTVSDTGMAGGGGTGNGGVGAPQASAEQAPVKPMVAGR